MKIGFHVSFPTYRVHSVCKNPNKASNLFQPNSDLCAALDHMTHTVYGILEGSELFVNYDLEINRYAIIFINIYFII